MSYIGPVTNEVVIDAGQFDRFRVVATQSFNKALYRAVEIEDHAARVRIPYHALQPEKRRDPRPGCYRRDHMQARSRIQHEAPGCQFDLVRTVIVVDDEFA